jgi:hypothetical protein
MDSIVLVLVLLGFPILVIWFCWKLYQKHKAKTWPATEATIQSGDLEVVNTARGMPIQLPAFAFTYLVNGERYSGRFALKPYISEPPAGFIDRMIGRKLQVLYNPAKPEQWYLPEDLLEGCKIEQKMGPHLVSLYPKD